MCNLAPKAPTSPKKSFQNHDPRQKSDTKTRICCYELRVASEPPNCLLVFPWTVCNGLGRLRHGFRRVSSHETNKTSVEVRYAYSEVQMSQLLFRITRICSEGPKSRFRRKTFTCCKPCGFWTTFLGAYGLALAVAVFYGVGRVVSRGVTAATSVCFCNQVRLSLPHH